MNKIQQIFKNKKGVTLIEAIVGVGLVSMIIMSLYLTLFNAVRLMGDSKQKIGAVALATERMEMIRNLEYEEIGIQDWIPAGPFLQEEVLTKNGFPYIIKTHIEYIDDPFDGVGVDDDTENDYKQARVEIIWTSGEYTRNVLFISNFVPDGLESDLGGGVLSVNVATPLGNPIANARVNVDSVEETEPIHGYSMTDAEGNIRLPGIPEQEYQIAVSKDGYETVQTYPNPPGSPFTPIDANIFVIGVVMKSFYIDKTASLKLKAVDSSSGDNIEGVEVNLVGGRLIGTDPDTFSLDDTSSTNSSGEIDYSGLSPGNYNIANMSELGTSTYDYVGADASIPIVLQAEDNIQVNLLFAEKTIDSLLMTVVDDLSGEPIIGADVRVFGNGFDQSAVTDSQGLVYFPLTEDPPVTMDPGSYQVEIQATGYQNYTDTVDVNQLTEKEARLST